MTNQSKNWMPVTALVLHHGNLMINRLTRRCSLNHVDVRLSTREYELLETLLLHRGSVCKREELLSNARSPNRVDLYVCYLRKKLGAELIRSVHGEGYTIDLPIDAPVDPAPLSEEKPA